MAVSTQVIQDTDRFAVIKITNDGATDESSAKVVKLDASTLSGAPTNTRISKIIADVMPTTGIVSLYYDGSTDALAWICNSHTDTKEFCEEGPLPNDATAPTGDILVQTNASGISYSILLKVLK
jgi:hypothetical protein